MNTIVKHRAYRNLDDYGVQFRNTSERAAAVGVEFPPEEVDPIMKIIQQPDPKTGLPRNELTLLFAADTNPEIREYMQRHIIAPLSTQGGTQDPDVAIDMVRHRGESDEQYIERLSGEIKTYNESVKESNNQAAE